jgi:hypothetical protein
VRLPQWPRNGFFDWAEARAAGWDISDPAGIPGTTGAEGGHASERWVRFQAGDGAVGFGTLEDDAVREHRGDMYVDPAPSGRRLRCRPAGCWRPPSRAR